MDPFFPLQQQWHHSAPSAWIPGMPNPWFPYPGMVPFADLGLQQSIEQQEPQSQLVELKPLHLQSLQPLTNHPQQPLHQLNYHVPPGVPAGTENTPPVSSAYHHSPYAFPLQHQLQLSKPDEACFSTPVPAAATADLPPSLDDESAAAAAGEGEGEGEARVVASSPPPSFPPALAKEETEGEKTLHKGRGQKRKSEKTLDLCPSNDAIPSPPKTQRINAPLMNNFCKVTGRLSVVGAQRTYYVSCEEIFRRTTMPECLNRSHIGPLLRRGKVKGCGDDLQLLLEERGLSSTSQVNRKRFPLTTLSAFIEQEAIRFNDDHKELLNTHFPVVAIARMVLRKIDNPRELVTTRDEITKAKFAAEHLEKLVEGWTEGGGEAEVNTVVGSRAIASFALSTHLLGTEELIMMTKLFSRFCSILLQECTAQIERLQTASQVNPYVMLMNQYPPNMEWAEFPNGPLVHKPDAAEEAQGSRCFAEIPGRLTLNNKKYTVTVAEIYRRVRAPESLNLSILGSQLRKGKTKDNGNSLRDELAAEGIRIDQGRRKSAKITLFTALLEDEALTLAKDVGDAIESSKVLESIRDSLILGISTPLDIHNRQAAYAAASRVASSLCNVILDLRLPVAERHPHSIHEHAYLIFNYCNLTHGYGPDACLQWMGTFRKLFDLAHRSLPQVEM